MIELSARQLRRAAGLKDKIEILQQDLARLLGSSEVAAAPGKRRTMSAAARAKIAAAQRARWARQRGEKADKPAVKAKRKMSAAGRAKIAAAAKARWAKYRAEKK